MGRVGTKLSIVFPMWNEESSIHLAVEAAREATAALVEAGDIDDYELVIVDDASRDATPELADDLAAADPHHVVVTHHAANQGLGGSIKTGLALATGDLVLYTDADLPCDLLESLTRATRLLRIYDADVVSAYRHDRTAEGPRRAVYTFAYNSLIRVAFGLRVRDVNFAFKLVRRPVLDAVGPLASGGSFIDAELLLRAHRLGYHIIQFGVDYFPRTRGVSTLSSGTTILRIVREMVALRPVLAESSPCPTNPPGRPLPSTLPPRTGRDADDVAPLRLHPSRRAPADRQRRRLRPDRAGLPRHPAGPPRRASSPAPACWPSPPASPRPAPWLSEEPGLGVGVHLAAVGEDPPLLTAAEVPSLVDRRGRLAASWQVFLARATAGRIDPADVAARVPRAARSGAGPRDARQPPRLPPAPAPLAPRP